MGGGGGKPDPVIFIGLEMDPEDLNPDLQPCVLKKIHNNFLKITFGKF